MLSGGRSKSKRSVRMGNCAVRHAVIPGRCEAPNYGAQLRT
jgi:hypothetical protein